MPLYDYTCEACNKKEEKLVKLADADSQTCEECGGQLERNRTYEFSKHSSWTEWQVGLATQRRG